jgi:tripartite-type tricarboxylate transporter receptor subunit TctC
VIAVPDREETGMTRRILKWGLAALAVPLAATPAAADPVADFYKDRTMTLMVSAGVGGGYDLYARTVARHISKHLPGNPNIIVQNRVGAGGLVLANFMYNVAPRDGSVFAAVHRNMATDPLIGDKGDRIKYVATEFQWIGSANSEVSICASRSDSPVKTFQDAIENEIILGAEPNTDIEQFPVVMNNLIGTRFRVITGYPSGTGVNLAMERGEVQGRCGWSWSSFKAQRLDWMKSGQAHVFVQVALKKHPDIPEVPLVMDYVKDPDAVRALRLIFSRQQFGRPFFAPPGVPGERVAALRKAFSATMKDPEFIAEIEKQNLELDPMDGGELQALVEDLYTTPKAVVDLAIRATQPQAQLAKAEIKILTHKGPIAEVAKGGQEVVFTHGGNKVKTTVSGSRTQISVAGKKADRKQLKAGMTCSFTYPGAGQEASKIDCEG